jgi:RND family efflux transporter MFP subunit
LNFRRLTALLAALLAAGLVACSKPEASASTGAAQPPSVLTVEVSTPQMQTWPQLVQASGALAAWQEVIVAPEIGGLRLVDLAVDVGAQVRRGQLLARLADDTLRNDQRKQQAAVAQARAARDQAESNLRRASMAAGSGALSAQRIEEYRIAAETSRAALEAAQAELDGIALSLSQTRVHAADDGVVSSKSAVLGSVVSAGNELFRLVRQGRVEWRPEVDAQQVAGLRPGRLARVALPTGEVVEGEVRLVEPTLSARTGRLTVHVSLPLASRARPGGYASGSIELDERPALTVPATAVVARDGRAYVYLVGTDDTVHSRPVVTGRSRDDQIEILDGVNIGERIVARGGAFLSENARVTVVGPASAPARGAKGNAG